jgi:AraC family transcriptional regulator
MADRTAPASPVSGPHLGEGQFFSEVLGRRRTSGFLLSELHHGTRRQFPRHMHERAYFCLLLSGSYAEQITGRPFEQEPMNVAFHPPALVHRDEVGERGARFFSLEIDDRWIESLRDEEPPDLAFGVASEGDPLWLALRLYCELRHFEPDSPLTVECLGVELLRAVLHRPRRDERQPPPWLGRIEDLLRESYREPLTLDRLTAEAGIHPVHLTRTFRRFHGRTPGEYVQELRVRQVCRALSDPQIPLVDIALDAGFADQSHCTRIFKRITGTTPGSLRLTLAERASPGRPSAGPNP